VPALGLSPGSLPVRKLGAAGFIFGTHHLPLKREGFGYVLAVRILFSYITILPSKKKHGTIFFTLINFFQKPQTNIPISKQSVAKHPQAIVFTTS